jgi:integrase
MTTRRQRGGVEDRWRKADGTPSASDGTGKRWRARYVDDRGREHERRFDRKADAQRWLGQQSASVVDGRHVAPRDAQITVREWCETWLAGYQGRRPNTVANARVYIREITDEFGDMPLSALRPSHVKTWVAKLLARPSTRSDRPLSARYANNLHAKLRQILEDAVHDDVLGRNPCSIRTSPPAGKSKLYVATAEQVKALHDVMPDHLKAAVLLGAFAGLRRGEVCGLRVSDVDFMRGIVHPKQQPDGAPLKNDGSCAPIPIPRNVANTLAASVARYGTDMVVTNGRGGPCRQDMLGRAISGHEGNRQKGARDLVDGLPEEFTFHDLRHFYASKLIADKHDIIEVSKRMRHAKPSITLDVYAHLFDQAGSEDRTRDTMGKLFEDMAI